jgi:predicted nucleic acid-binding protein
VTLCDAGPLVALINDADTHHARCVATLQALPDASLLTTWACLAEAMHLLSQKFGWRAQDALWALFADDVLRLHVHGEDEWERMRVLMRKYADTPMDLGDASLVVAAETLRQRRVFTVDWHFYVYRQRLGEAFEVVP